MGPPRTGMGVTPDWYGGRPGLVWGSPRTGGRPRHHRQGMGDTPDWYGVTPDRYGGHPGLVWGSPRTDFFRKTQNVKKMTKIKNFKCVVERIAGPNPTQYTKSAQNGVKTIFNNTPNIGFRVFFVIFYVFFACCLPSFLWPRKARR